MVEARNGGKEEPHPNQILPLDWLPFARRVLGMVEVVSVGGTVRC